MKRFLFAIASAACLAFAIAGYADVLKPNSTPSAPTPPQPEPQFEGIRAPDNWEQQERAPIDIPVVPIEPLVPPPAPVPQPDPVPLPAPIIVPVPVPGPEFKDLAAASVTVRLSGAVWIVEGLVENRGEGILRGPRPVRLERFDGAWKPLKTVFLSDLFPGAKSKIHVDLASQPKADATFRLSVWGDDDRNANNALTFKMPSAKADLAATSLVKLIVGPSVHLRAIVKNLGQDPSAPRNYRFERRTGAAWSVVQTGSMTSVLTGQSVTLDASLAGLPSAEEYRIVLAGPSDVNPSNDFKTFVPPVEDLAIVSFAKVGNQLKARIGNTGTTAYGGGRSYKIERKLGAGPWTVLTMNAIPALAAGSEDQVTMIVAAAPPGSHYRISLTGTDAHPANDTKILP